MTDLDTAKAHLSGHSLCLCKDGAWFTDDGRGISPMLRLIGENRGLRGYAAADIIVGKAAAMLFVKAGVAAVYGEVMSKAGKAYLEAHGIPCADFGSASLALFRHGTARFAVYLMLVLLQNVTIQTTTCSGAAPPSPRGKAFACLEDSAIRLPFVRSYKKQGLTVAAVPCFLIISRRSRRVFLTADPSTAGSARRREQFIVF